ncbi:hypothetical protein [Rufibacter sp. LB8]|uniref:hypothetical protein n=1 Tax=Rufibacter sp. LB8 TaxID=2777781 RepID=UPI00178C362D|nr:hypothetical protein [Rufibacter sp. LB8]
MEIHAITAKPESLIKAINKAITDGKLRTWAIVTNDKKENLYTHIPEQWNGKAMPKPYIFIDKVSFKISWWNKNGEPEESTKGYILGRFTEVLMVHFRDHFEHLETYK